MVNTEWRNGSIRDSNGSFVIPWLKGKFPPPFSSVMKWWWNKSAPSFPTEQETKEWFPTVKPDWESIAQKGSSITWLGHATCYLFMANGLRILTDPVFSQRASPFQWAGPARYVQIPCPITEIPTPHIVLISHDHYDHLDIDGINLIESNASDIKPTYFVGLGLKSWFSDSFSDKIAEDRIVELDWWQNHKLSVQQDTQTVSADVEMVPAQHWGSRNHFDAMTRLWGGFIVKDSENKRFFFAGDTGYNEEMFAEIGKRHGPIDVAAIPIGAYEPRWFMHPQHVDPAEAHQIHKLVRSNLSLGIHWGTFILTDEPLLEPKELIENICKEDPKTPPFITLNHGATRQF